VKKEDKIVCWKKFKIILLKNGLAQERNLVSHPSA